MKFLLISLCLLAPAAALAENLCAVRDPARLAELAGDWRGAQSVSVESLDVSRHGTEPDHIITLTVDAAGTLVIASEFIDSLVGSGLPMVLALDTPYDVDRVDDVLDTTEAAQVADTLSDTRCGPENLPQLVARIAVGEELTVTGTVTLIPYFSDRMLQIDKLELQSGDALIYMTATTLLRPAPSGTE